MERRGQSRRHYPRTELETGETAHLHRVPPSSVSCRAGTRLLSQSGDTSALKLWVPHLGSKLWLRLLLLKESGRGSPGWWRDWVQHWHKRTAVRQCDVAEDTWVLALFVCLCFWLLRCPGQAFVQTGRASTGQSSERGKGCLQFPPLLSLPCHWYSETLGEVETTRNNYYSALRWEERR